MCVAGPIPHLPVFNRDPRFRRSAHKLVVDISIQLIVDINVLTTAGLHLLYKMVVVDGNDPP